MYFISLLTTVFLSVFLSVFRVDGKPEACVDATYLHLCTSASGSRLKETLFTVKMNRSTLYYIVKKVLSVVAGATHLQLTIHNATE